MQMEDMLRLFSMMSNSSNSEEEKPNEQNNDSNETSDSDDNNFFNGINFAMLEKMSELFALMNKPDMNGELLFALKPHLRAQNRHKIDTSVKISKMISLFPFIKDSGILNDLF